MADTGNPGIDAKTIAAPLATNPIIPSIVLGLVGFFAIMGTYNSSFIGGAIVGAPLLAAVAQHALNKNVYTALLNGEKLNPNAMLAVLAVVLVYPIQLVSSFGTAKFLCGDAYLNKKSIGRLALYALVPFAAYVLLLLSQTMSIGLAPTNLPLIENLTNIYFVFCVIVLASTFAMWAYFDNRPCHLEAGNQAGLVDQFFAEQYGNERPSAPVYQKKV
jgi:hypothetical protein